MSLKCAKPRPLTLLPPSDLGDGERVREGLALGQLGVLLLQGGERLSLLQSGGKMAVSGSHGRGEATRARASLPSGA